MKKLSLQLLLAGAFAVCFTACKKDEPDPTPTPTTQNQQATTQADDNARVSKELDDMTKDVNDAVSATPSMSGGRVDEILPCDATVLYDTLDANRQITITYDGTSCDGQRTRTGVVTVAIPVGVNWTDVNAVLSVDIQDLHITRLSDNKSITVNGLQTITNTTGGLVAFLSSLESIKHRIEGDNLNIAFDDSTNRNWSVDKQHHFEYDNGIKFSVTGMHAEGSTTGIVEWGTARDGSEFQTIIDEALTIRQDCNFRLTSGKETIKNLTTNQQLTLEFGLNAQGEPAVCPGLGMYYMKIGWTDWQGNPQHLLYPYW